MSNNNNNKTTTPAGSGGLMRFSDEYPSKLRISPEWVMIIVALVIIGMTALRLILK